VTGGGPGQGLLLGEFDFGAGGVDEASPAFEVVEAEFEFPGGGAGEHGGPFFLGFVGAGGFQAEDQKAVFVIPGATADTSAIIGSEVRGQVGTGFDDGEAFGVHTVGLDLEDGHFAREVPGDVELDGAAVVGSSLPLAEHPIGIGRLDEGGEGCLGDRGEGEGGDGEASDDEACQHDWVPFEAKGRRTTAGAWRYWLTIVGAMIHAMKKMARRILTHAGVRGEVDAPKRSRRLKRCISSH